tara:strand:+ start:19855 stop:20079 length:225 start_codon:yes stop_codon:yes gene_type:complete
MPLYNVESDGRAYEINCTYNELKERETNGEFTILPSTPAIVSGQGSVQGHTDSNFNDLLTNIKGKHRGSTIKTK